MGTIIIRTPMRPRASPRDPTPSPTARPCKPDTLKSTPRPGWRRPARSKSTSPSTPAKVGFCITKKVPTIRPSYKKVPPGYKPKVQKKYRHKVPTIRPKYKKNTDNPSKVQKKYRQSVQSTKKVPTIRP